MKSVPAELSHEANEPLVRQYVAVLLALGHEEDAGEAVLGDGGGGHALDVGGVVELERLKFDMKS